MLPNVPKLSHGHGRLAQDCNLDFHISHLNQKPKGQWPLGQLLGITQRTLRAVYDHSKQRFSPRKLIPVNAKSTGDYLLLKRIEANLSQHEVAVKSGVSERTVRAWEHDDLLPNQAQWQALAGILALEVGFPTIQTQH